MKKTVQELISNPTMSEKAMSGVTFSSDDRQFIKREFDGVLFYIKDQMTETQRFLAEILIDNNASFNKNFDAIMGAILEIKRDMKEIRLEIKELKLDIKTINLDLLFIHKQLLEHNQRLQEIEKQHKKDKESNK